MNAALIARIAVIAALAAAYLGVAAPGQEPPPPQDASAQPKDADQEPPAEGIKAETTSAESDVTTPGPGDQPDQPTADEIIREFQKERPTAVPVLPTGEEDELHLRSEDDEEQNGRKSRPLLPDGCMIFDRAGRIAQEGDDWLFIFESDNESYAEPPMQLLPNQTLERMVRESQGGLASVVFIVSGEITEFRGENYLLPRKVLRRRELGNLKK